MKFNNTFWKIGVTCFRLIKKRISLFFSRKKGDVSLFGLMNLFESSETKRKTRETPVTEKPLLSTAAIYGLCYSELIRLEDFIIRENLLEFK